jgi:hypothetical protein
MREIRTSGLTRGSNGTGVSLPLLSTLPVELFFSISPRPTHAVTNYLQKFEPQMDADGRRLRVCNFIIFLKLTSICVHLRLNSSYRFPYNQPTL